MEEGVEGKCSALCQHPSCWYTENKLSPVHKRPSGYSHYVAELITRRKLRESQRGESEGGCALIGILAAVPCS